MFRVKSAFEEDIPLIFDIEREAFSPPWSFDALLGEANRGDSFFAVARGDETPRTAETFGSGCAELPPILGFVILRRIADDGELLQIAVKKTARRRGVADALLDAALGFAKEAGCSSVFLEVRKSNDAALALYEKHGFKTVRCRKDYFSDPVEDAIVMVKVSIL